MNKGINFCQSAGRVCLVVGIFIIVSLPACSKAPEDPAWFQSKSNGESLDQDALISRIEEVDDIFVIYRMREEYRRRGGQSEEINNAMAKRWKDLLSNHSTIGSPCEESDLIAFDYRKIGPERYRADYLFKAKRSFKTDFRILLYGVVAPEDLNNISETRRKAGKKSNVWNFNPVPPTSAWTAGDYYLLSQTISSTDIPYNMSMIFYDPARQPGQYGEKVQLGWRSGITEEDLLNNIDWADDLIDLYRLEGDCANMSAARKAFSAKGSALLEKTSILGRISDEAELVAFDYSKIGDDQYRVDYLFRILSPLEKDCVITLYGVVDENHHHLLSEDRRRLNKKSEAWSFQPYPSTLDWQEGEYVLVSGEINAHPIPYNMHSILYDREGRIQHGNQVPLGWRVDLGESKEK